ncbi:Glycosyltransferase, GT2 family [Arenibacter nanhaiticus]|uniref:Glycosyltransferase, GT2 family n=1 Tax=Arenibacter nanhaiticus TaxID=558155 RepID=A0A1M6A2N5_9FLAO|nr:glycosyltransferase family 2 protein [Arenibacter nanhaiticus]SHI30730.1 Glycosyltransferase, GT2 family [Arenibacter nanhaiticus]
MTKINEISILVVTHNHSDYIDKLINSLEKFGYNNVYFCDAKSNDNTYEKLINSSFKKNVLKKDVLEGFSKNNNDLIRHFNLQSKYFLLLNPDTYFDVDFLKVLKSEMESNEGIGIVTPLMKYPNGDLQITWKHFPNFYNVLKKRLGILKAKFESQMEGPEIDWCLGACMLISNRLLKERNTLLDERYRLYCEDIDICFEAFDKNMKVIGLSNTYIYHNLNESSSKNIFSKYNLWNISSIVKFILKWNWKYLKRVYV